jgi:hypothetical protein
MRRTLGQITLADLIQSEGQVTELVRSRLMDAIFEPSSNLITLTQVTKD